MGKTAVNATATQVRRRRWLRRGAYLLAFVAVNVILADHLGAFGYRGDDLRRFDRQTATIRAVAADATVSLTTANGTERATLIGVDPSSDAAGYLRSFVSRQVLIRLEPLKSRDASGRLWAYLYPTDEDLLNADVVREGWAKADRRTKHSMAAVIDAAEAEAKKRRRGVWRAASATTTSTTRPSD